MGSAEAAEMAKLVETTYRDVNIALANEFALYAQGLGVDFGRVVDACNSQPYSHVHRPGIAVGGHCIPVYPHLYLANDPDAAVVRTSRAANEALPDRWLGVLEGVTGPLAEKQVAVLGAGFRGDVRETAFSGIHPIVRILLQKGAEVRVHDPLQSDDDLRAMGFEPFHRGMSADVVVVQADHSEYRTWSAQDVPGVRAVLDGRGILDPVQWAGVPVVSVLGRLDTQ
jgi:nucleotide sugar dehydrogenase